MSTRKFMGAIKKMLEGTDAPKGFEQTFDAVSERMLDTSRRLEERSKKIKEDRERGARITKHRISL